jgi:hypothetical protein
MCAPLPPKFDTRLTVFRQGGDIVIAALLCKSLKGMPPEQKNRSESLEILFGLRNDGFGYTQFVFKEGAAPQMNEFAPYQESKSTAEPPLRIKRWGFDHTPTNGTMFATIHTVFHAVFSEEEIFARGPVVGFNFCRSGIGLGEFSSWSFLAGNGAPDANSLGQLHQTAKTLGAPSRPPRVPPAKSFRVSITNDSPMVVVNRHYTPASLDAEMQAIKGWGVDRLHWIDYSNYPSFWAMRIWDKQAAKTFKACGNLLEAACRAARKNKIELVPDFKVFDLSFVARPETPRQKDTLPGFDGSDILCIPEMPGREEAFIQTNPVWRRRAEFPIRTLRLFSLEPLPKIETAGIRISESADNVSYRPIPTGKSKIVVKKTNRANRRWTPAGAIPENGSQPCWMIEWTGLEITQPFVNIEIPDSQGSLFHRHFALVEALGADGRESPFLCSGDRPYEGADYLFDYAGKWPGWNNYNDHAVGFARIPLRSFGITFIEPLAINGLLEPTHPVAQKIWLNRVDYYLEHDVAGVSIRTLCHHRRCPSWLQYAFAPTVVEAFRKRHGRDPVAEEEDYAQVRRLRGEALGDFLAAASGKIRARQKKVIFQVEQGSELPALNESRMAMTYDYEKWISSGLFDELHVRSITGHSPWLRKTLLPLARRHGVEVHLMTRNHATGFGPTDFLDVQKIAADAKTMGYSGLNFYESANLYELTDAETLLARAMGELCVREAVRVGLSA